MSTKTIELSGDLTELKMFFKDTLREINFIILDEENFSDRFRIFGVNKKRTSLMAITMLSLIGGYIPQKRVALELIAWEKNASLGAMLKCIPYIDTIDMEATVETPQESERCENLAKLLVDKITKRFSLGQ